MKKFLQIFFIASLLTITPIFLEANSCGSCGSCENVCNTCDDNCANNCCFDSGNCCLGCCDGYPFLLPRSQSRNAARQLVGWQEFINQYDMESVNGAFYIGLEYTRSFRPWYLAQYLFGCDLDRCDTLIIQGSQVEDRHSRAWLADYFGLSPAFDTRVSFCPRIQNVVVELNCYLGLDELVKGLFFRVSAPITWTKWELNMCESIIDDGKEGMGVGFEKGYMHQDAIARDTLPNSFIEAVSGTTVFGDMKESMKFGKITNCELTTTRLADIRASLGWNFISKKDMHFGIFFHAAAPTGNRPKACYLFEPIVGNGHHWEAGVGITSSYIFYRNEDNDDQYIGVWLDATFSHLFKDCQCRSFDFCGKPNSRYMLLEELGANDDESNKLKSSNTSETPTLTDLQYKKNLIPAINWSTFDVDVKIALQADVALKIGYVQDNWSIDLGYNLWARTGEKFCTDCSQSSCSADSCSSCGDSSCSSPSERVYAIKGDAFIYGFIDQNTVHALSATQCNANIHSGRNYPAQNDDNPITNPRVNNPEQAFINSTKLLANDMILSITTSQPSILVSRNQLNLGKSPSAITHKFFGHISYAWKNTNDDFVPFVGIGVQVEFAQKGDCCKQSDKSSSYTTSCNSSSSSGCGTYSTSRNNNKRCTSKRAGVYQWGLWAKGGITFN